MILTTVRLPQNSCEFFKFKTLKGAITLQKKLLKIRDHIDWI